VRTFRWMLPSAALAALAALSLLLRAGLPEASAAETGRKSGYALTDQQCGQAPRAYPKLRIGMRDGYCAGLVASKQDGLIFPRSIVQIPGQRQFVIADMGGWNPGQGRLLLLDPDAPEDKRITKLIDRLDFPFGLEVGPDRKIYASTDQTIFRFDPMSGDPRSTMETIIRGLPGNTTTLSDGNKIKESAHPLKSFVFDRNGRLYVNIGAPTDNCLPASTSKACAAGEGGSPLASIWAFTPPLGGIFPALKSGDASPRHEVFARGLRNSMALAMHPEFPADGFAFLQGENGRDLPDPQKPNEELNAIEKGKHYGWPYCYDLSTVSPEFKPFLQVKTPYQGLCGNAALYRQPLSLLPPHAAPLSMFYYSGTKFAELQGRLVVGLHGYRPTGSRILFYDVDEKGFPKISPPPVRYRVSCAAEPSRTFQTEAQPRVAASAFTELVSEWHKVNGIRPQGAQVGMTVASDGAIWLVEDKNQTVIRIDAAPSQPQDVLPCDARSQAQIDELAKFVETNASNRQRLTQIRTGLVEKHCHGCHADFGLKAEMTDRQKDDAALRFMLSQDGWIYPGDPGAGRLHTRLNGIGAEKIMPPGGENQRAQVPGYKQLLASLDVFAGTMVPGRRMRIKGGRVDRRFVNRAGHECGTIPSDTVVVVVDRQPKEKPSFSRIYRPADLYLNGECTDVDGYYIEQVNLVAL
jgi:glucose/arabinose dehydrogenase